MVAASTIIDSRYGRDDCLLIFRAHFAAMAYGEAVEWWGRLMEFGVQNCVSGFELQEDAPRVIFVCVYASEGMD